MPGEVAQRPLPPRRNPTEARGVALGSSGAEMATKARNIYKAGRGLLAMVIRRSR
jgi:hypothetical protein